MANPQNDPRAVPNTSILLGEPFVVACEEIELLPQGPDYPGCVLCVACQCGSAFELDLLDAGYKSCPGCGVEYTHALVIGRRDDDQLADDFLKEVVSNQAGIHAEAQTQEAAADDDDGAPDDGGDDDDDDDGQQAPVRPL